MSNVIHATASTIAAHEQVVHFPKGQKPSLASNEWLIWTGSQDEGGLPNLEHGKQKVLAPFTWWRSYINSHHNEADIQSKVKAGHIEIGRAHV